MNHESHWINTYQHLCRTEKPVQSPIIGITGNFGSKGCELAPGYYQSVFQGGATPLVIPPLEDIGDIETILERVDGLVFSGGGDLNPLLLGEEPSPELHSICPQRDLKELLLLRMALDRQMPMLCICRGIQLLAAATGGHLYQDIPTESKPCGKPVKHSQEADRSCATHTIELKEGSLLRNLFQKERIAVNSFHHQAVSEVGADFRITAQSADGIIEGIESKIHPSVIGVQWHPECFILNGDRCMMPLFKWLAHEAGDYAAARRLHASILSLDTHCDTPMLFDQHIRFNERDDRTKVDLHKMQEGRLDAAILAAYLPQKGLDEASLNEATRYCNQLLDEIEEQIGRCPQTELASTPDELYRLKSYGIKAIMKGIENGYAIGRNIENLIHFRQRGVVYMTLCHNGDNLICDSASKTEHTHNGLSPFGREVVHEMNRIGMMVDLSHAGEKTFWDVLETSSLPVVCSHSSCQALCQHPRNLTDEQLKALAQQGGVCQITFYPGFLREEGKGTATIEDALLHLKHAIDVAGIEHVGIGSDFDGDGGVPGLNDASQLINLTRRLQQDFSYEEIQAIWGGNFLRVMKQVQQASQQ